MEDCNKHIRGKLSTRLPVMSDREDQQSSKTLYATEHNKHCEHVRLRTPTHMYDGEDVHVYQACAMENINKHV